MGAKGEGAPAHPPPVRVGSIMLAATALQPVCKV